MTLPGICGGRDKSVEAAPGGNCGSDACGNGRCPMFVVPVLEAAVLCTVTAAVIS